VTNKQTNKQKQLETHKLNAFVRSQCIKSCIKIV